MTISINADTPRLDRLSALLLAVAPRVVPLYPHVGGANTLWIGLIAEPSSSAPHSVAITPSQGTAKADVAFQVHLEGPAAPLLMREFAQPLVLKLVDADAALHLVVQVLWIEIVSPRCGQPVMLTHAGNMLFIGLLRHLVGHPRAERGLFSGLSDPRIAKALVAMHAHPQLSWNLATLAEHAGMSRTSFATHFKSIMGTSPGKYLAQIRLLVAQRAVQSGTRLKGAASQSGYKDASALSRALGRHTKYLESATQSPI
ncbi:MAG: helix-turn-helix transcriptional regulator [Comamonadaceae bacterium]|nr:helix-turn-helix transcriptional regulator [Comamonadaceae bacterium]